MALLPLAIQPAFKESAIRSEPQQMEDLKNVLIYLGSERGKAEIKANKARKGKSQ
jgi:hypothetical protein